MAPIKPFVTEAGGARWPNISRYSLEFILLKADCVEINPIRIVSIYIIQVFFGEKILHNDLF